MVIPIFNVVLVSDNDENAIDNGKHVVLFHLSRYSDKLYGNTVYHMQIEMIDFIQVPASLVFAIYKLTTAVTAFLIAFLIKSNNKKLDQTISKLLTLSKYFTRSAILFCTCGRFLNIPRGYLHYN